MKVTDQLIRKLEHLSMFTLTDQERQEIVPNLESMISMIDLLKEVDTENTEPLVHINSEKQVLRDDVVSKMLDKDEALANSKNSVGDYFTVPKVIK